VPKKKIYDYEASDIVVQFEPKRCIHAEECVHGLPDVFDRHSRPWIEPEKRSADEVGAGLSRGRPRAPNA
jgi:uncharacterized Fe-S cluster protein YjdI